MNSTRNLEAAVMELQRQGVARDRVIGNTATRLQQLEKTLESRLAADEGAIQKQSDILELLAKEVRECKARTALLEQNLQGVAANGTAQHQQLGTNLNGVSQQLGQLTTDVQRVAAEGNASIARHDSDLQRMTGELGGLRQTAHQVQTQAEEWNTLLGSRIDAVAGRQGEMATVTDGRHEQVLGRLQEQADTQEQDRQRLSDVVKKGLEVQSLKQVDLESRLNTDVRTQFQEMVKMVQKDRDARSQFENDARVSMETRSALLYTHVYSCVLSPLSLKYCSTHAAPMPRSSMI